jgi:hypothetical protein
VSREVILPNMELVLFFGTCILCQMLINRTLWYLLRDRTPSRRAFALIFGGRLASPILLLLCVAFLFGGMKPLPLPLIYVSMGMTGSFFIFGYAVSYYLYEPVVRPIQDYFRNFPRNRSDKS